MRVCWHFHGRAGLSRFMKPGSLGAAWLQASFLYISLSLACPERGDVLMCCILIYSLVSFAKEQDRFAHPSERSLRELPAPCVDRLSPRGLRKLPSGAKVWRQDLRVVRVHPPAVANAPDSGSRLALVTVGEAGPQVPSPGPQRETVICKKLYLDPNEFCGLETSSCTSGSSFRGDGNLPGQPEGSGGYREVSRQVTGQNRWGLF